MPAWTRRTPAGLGVLCAACVAAWALAVVGGFGGRAPASAAAATPTACAAPHWVGTWIASPSDAKGGQSLDDQTLRMIVAPHLAGSSVRVHLSNRYGSAPITLGPVTIGLRASGAAISPGSLQAVTFAGRRTVTIPAGAEVVSDPVALAVRPFADIAVSVFVPGTITNPTEHSITRQTSYLSPAQSGDHSGEPAAGAFTQTTPGAVSNGWYFLDGLDVSAPAGTGAVVTFGDSITDGFQGSQTPVTEQMATIDRDTRYPDDLARRINAAGIPLSVLNAGISGNRVLQDGQLPTFGPAAVTRFGADALDQRGVTDVLVLEGINDIGQTTGITAQQLIGGYQRLIAAAHAAHLRIQLATLTPSGGTVVPSYGDASANQLREQVNAWIRSQHLADGVVDFDAAVRDPRNPSRIAPPYDGSDHLHFSPAGYQRMADAVDLGALARTACGAASPASRPGGVVEVRCASRRTVRIHLPRRELRRLRSAAVFVGGRRVGTVRPGHTAIRIDLRGRGRGATGVRIVIRLRGGRARVERRLYHPCVPGRRSR